MTEANDRIPELEVFEGALYKLPEQQDVVEGEVFTELETHALKANTHHRERQYHDGWALAHAIWAGNELRAAKQKVVKKRGDGTWQPWLSDNFEGAESTATKYMRISAKAEKVGFTLENYGHSSQMSIGEFEREHGLEASEGKKELKAGDAERKKAEKELEKKKKELKAEERRIQQEQNQLDKELRRFEKLDKRERDLQRLEDKLEARSEKIEKDFRDALAALYAKHGVEEVPSFADIPAEAWREAFDEAQDQRVINIGKQLEQLSGWPEWMGEYLPGEAAAALEDMPYGDRVTEALYYVIDWLQRAVDEVEAKRGEVRNYG